MKTERVAMFVVRLALELAGGIAGWLERKEEKRPVGGGLSLKDLLEIKKANDAQVRRSEAPTVAVPPPSEWRNTPTPRKPGGGSSRY